MSDPIQDYARAVAEAVHHAVADRFADELPFTKSDYDAIIATVPAPDVQAQVDAAARKALYQFAGWLTNREERIVLSAHDDAAPILEAVASFLITRSAKGE